MTQGHTEGGYTRRKAKPKLRFTRSGISIVYRGKVMHRVQFLSDANAFMEGWNNSAVAIRAVSP